MSFTTETTEELLEVLVAQPRSITPDRSDCHKEIASRLEQMGFKTEMLSFGEEDKQVNNLWATYGKPPYLVFCGHTDVVPPGDESLWKYPPFSLTNDNGIIYGRGVVDMKGSIAAFLTATRDYLSQEQTTDNFNNLGLAFLITGDEEGDAVNGVESALRELEARGETAKIKYCLVGEPTCEERFGDVIKNGRRGSLSLSLTLQGNQGHAAYISKEENLLHRVIKFAGLMLDEDWDKDLTNEQQPPPTGHRV